MSEKPEQSDIHVRLPLAQPMDTGELFSEFRTALVKTLTITRKIGQGSATYNGRFRAQVTRILRSLKVR